MRPVINSMRVFLLALVISGFSQLIAQENPGELTPEAVWQAALPFNTSYAPKDYQAHEQNWCFAQDTRGIMYVGNTSGVLEFDGINWRLLPLPNGSPAKSLALSSDNTIYVGAVRDLGRLQADSTGNLQFESLTHKLDSIYRDFVDIWFTYAVGDTVYFISDAYVFRWQGEAFKVWEPQEFFGFAFQVGNKIYVDNRGRGIMEIQGDSLVLIPDGDHFLEGGLTTLLPYGEHKLLAANARDGLFVYDHIKFEPLLAQGQGNLLKDQFVYAGKALPNGDIAMLTHGNGCFILSPHGQIKQWLNKAAGLSSEALLGGFVDREGSLWVAGENGIDRLELSSPSRKYGQSSGLTEVVNSTLYHQNRWYAATFNGLFYLSEVSGDPEKKRFQFQAIDGIANQTWDIKGIGHHLLVANFNGLYQLNPNLGLQLILKQNINNLCHSQLDNNRVYAGSVHGDLFILELIADQWRAKAHNLKVEGRIMKMEENGKGSLWISTRYNGVYKLDWHPMNLSRTFDQNYTLTHYDTLHGLPEISYNVVFKTHSNIYFSTSAGIYQFAHDTQMFTPAKHLMEHLGTSTQGLENQIAGSNDGGMWITQASTSNNRLYKYQENQVSELMAARRFSDHQAMNVLEVEDLMLLSGATGVVVYNQSLEVKGDTIPITNLRGVNFGDSLLYGGHVSQQVADPVVLPFEKKMLRFSYTLSGFQIPEKHQFQTYLQGFDDDWTSWTAETQRDFTNLPEGDYIFKVIGRNLYGRISMEDSFSFSILPPWYRSWWAYVVYLILFIGFIGLVVQLRSRQLRKEKAALEDLVSDRTRQLQQQAQQLKEMDQMKSRLFANISHEFRTPLTLIKGPVDQLLKENKEELPLADAQMIDRNADRLLRLVNQLLDLSKLDAGSLLLQPKPGDIYQFLRALAAAFTSHAQQRSMEYHIQIPQVDLHLLFDHDSLEKVMYNLLSNAFKFTPDEGCVNLSVDYQDPNLRIKVSDSGRGINSDRLHLIFDRFYQVDPSITREHEGTGVGLALTKELVTLMEGEITVKSEPQKGTTFKVSLPLKTTEIRPTQHLTEKPDHPAPGSLPTEEPVLWEEEHDGELLVLVVEDNPDMRTFIRRNLDGDYKIMEATHGEQGLKLAREQVPDLIVTDLMMPKMDGLELCEKLKTDERTSHIPVVMLTAKAGMEHKIEGLETGADDYLTKPFDRQELQVRVKNLIQQRELLRKRFRREVTLEPKQIAITTSDEKFLNKLKDHLEQNLGDGSFAVPQLQDALAMSKTQLYRKMKALTDQSPGEFLRNYRLKRAARFLSEKSDNVTQIAYAVGFNNLSYFAKCFKELYGVAPSEYLRSPSS